MKPSPITTIPPAFHTPGSIARWLSLSPTCWRTSWRFIRRARVGLKSMSVTVLFLNHLAYCPASPNSANLHCIVSTDNVRRRQPSALLETNSTDSAGHCGCNCESRNHATTVQSAAPRGSNSKSLQLEVDGAGAKIDSADLHLIDRFGDRRFAGFSPRAPSGRDGVSGFCRQQKWSRDSLCGDYNARGARETL